MHQQEVDVVDVADEEGLVARRHHVLGLLVGTETDLKCERALVSDCPRGKGPSIVSQVGASNIPPLPKFLSSSAGLGAERTEGMVMLPRKRRRTRLSIPLGLRHDRSTRIKRSLWWRLKSFVPVNTHPSIVSF